MNPVIWPPHNNGPDKTLVTRNSGLAQAISNYLRQEQVHKVLDPRIESIYLPMADWILNHKNNGQLLIVGLTGAQGCGKSTLAGLLQVIFQEGYDLTTAILSLDDLYLGKTERKKLAANVHPMLATRGVPGTHDIELGMEIIRKLSQRGRHNVAVPRFDKSSDDRQPESDWPIITTPIDVLVLEGWCLGVTPQASEQLIEPTNELEANEDPNTIWRTYVNQQLADNYLQLFSKVGPLLALKALSMQHVFTWRELQEQRLIEKNGTGMSHDELRRFIMHFERLSRHQLLTVANYADALLTLDKDHQIADITLRDPAS